MVSRLSRPAGQRGRGGPYESVASLGEPWLWGPISRQEAEDLIRKHKGDDGLFLVRQSNSVRGAYALTCSFDV